MRAIHQLVAGLQPGDAISNEAFVLRNLFRSWGCEADLFAEPRHIGRLFRREAFPAHGLAERCRPDDIVLLHLSIGSSVNDLFARLPCRKALLYHNITPPEFMAAMNPGAARLLARGREQLTTLAGVADVVLADSRFNAREMEALGYGPVGVLPLLLDLDRLQPTSRRTLRRFHDGMVNILFVGRCAPNKALDDLLRAFYYFQRYVEPRSRLLHVGSRSGAERYYALLYAMASDLGLRQVEWAGALPQQELNACYRAAHLFLCMSEHEGFCIPLLESMALDVPVLAYAAAAVPETLDGAGVLFHAKTYDLLAEMMGALVHPGPLRKAVIEGQRQRMGRYHSLDLAAELKQRLQPLLES